MFQKPYEPDELAKTVFSMATRPAEHNAALAVVSGR
jgi:hypothetical protein